jgi:hypothetical protein
LRTRRQLGRQQRQPYQKAAEDLSDGPKITFTIYK